ncbi:MAG: L-histidine N(alpha)-methyltransferase [Pseudomonadota bacterium]
MGSYRFFDMAPVRASMRDDVIGGLSKAQKSIPPKYFYDEAGSALFDEITRLPEYYPTRVETALYERRSADIARFFSADMTLIEYGSGSSRKIRALLEGLRPRTYVPIDISAEHMEAAAKELGADYDWLDICAVCADYSAEIELPDAIPMRQPMAFFPGSSIGNFQPADAAIFLGRVRAMVGAGGYLLIGVDTKKDVATLEAAYDDAAGVTARFNLNLLHHINRALGSNFDPSAFTHRARYNATAGTVQMFLVSRIAQSVTIGDHRFDFAPGEELHTENSFKYAPEEFRELAESAGWQWAAEYLDPDRHFLVALFRGV